MDNKQLALIKPMDDRNANLKCKLNPKGDTTAQLHRVVKNTKSNTMCWKGCRATGILVHFQWECKITTLENNLTVFKKLNVHLP